MMWLLLAYAIPAGLGILSMPAINGYCKEKFGHDWETADWHEEMPEMLPHPSVFLLCVFFWPLSFPVMLTTLLMAATWSFVLEPVLEFPGKYFANRPVKKLLKEKKVKEDSLLIKEAEEEVERFLSS
jgi:hypothetical protein